MQPNDKITIQWPDSGDETETTWGEFYVKNADDPDMLDEIEAQIAHCNYAEFGGGAAPVVWVFA